MRSLLVVLVLAFAACGDAPVASGPVDPDPLADSVAVTVEEAEGEAVKDDPPSDLPAPSADGLVPDPSVDPADWGAGYGSTDPSSRAPVYRGSRPSTATREISVEGEPTAIPVRLFEDPTFPLPFSTYVPGDWETHVVRTPGGMAAQMLMDAEAGLHLFVPHDQSDVAALARQRAGDGPGVFELGAEDRPAWANLGVVYGSNVIYVGAHDGTAFLLFTEAPAEYGDGMAPRARLVRDELRWLDDGTAL